MRDLKVSTKILGVIGAVVVGASLAIGWFVTRGAEDALYEQTRAQLEVERASRSRFLSKYFKRLHDQLGISSRQLVTQAALRDLHGAPEKLDALFRPYAAGLVEAFSYSNVLLVSTDGGVAYSFSGEAQGSNLRTGQATDGLSKAFT